MDSFEINKIIAAVLLTVLIIIGIGKFTDILFHVEKPKESAYKIEGLGKNLIPSATDFSVVDFYERVGDKEAALAARDLLKAEGIFAGYTSGAVMQGLKQYENLGFFDENSVVVLVFSDHGSRYLSKVYSDEWMAEQGFIQKDSNKVKQ